MYPHFTTVIEFEDINLTTHIVLPSVTRTAISSKAQELGEHGVEVVPSTAADRTLSHEPFIRPLEPAIHEDDSFQSSDQSLTQPHSGNGPRFLDSLTREAKASPHAPPNQPDGNPHGGSIARSLDTILYTSAKGDYSKKGFEVERELRLSVTNRIDDVMHHNNYQPRRVDSIEGTTLGNSQETVIVRENSEKNIQVKNEPQSISSAIRFQRQNCRQSPYQTRSKTLSDASAGRDINTKDIRNDRRKDSFGSRERTLNAASDPRTFGYASLEYREDKVRLKDVTTSWYTHYTSSLLERPPDLPANHVGLKHNDIFLHIHEAQPAKFLSRGGQMIISRLLEGVQMWIWNQALSEWEKIGYGEKRISTVNFIDGLSPQTLGDFSEMQLIEDLKADLGIAQNAWNEAAEQRLGTMSSLRHSTEEERKVLTQLAIDTALKDAQLRQTLIHRLKTGYLNEHHPPKGRLKESIIRNSMFTTRCREGLKAFAAVIDINPSVQCSTLSLLPTSQCYPGPDTTVVNSPLFRVDTSSACEFEMHSQKHSDTDRKRISVLLEELEARSPRSPEDMVSMFFALKKHQLKLVLDVVDDFRADGQRIVERVLEANARLQSYREFHQEHLDILNDYTDNMIDRLEHKLKLLQEKHSNNTTASVSLECGLAHTTEYLGNLWGLALQFLSSQDTMNTGNKVLNELYHIGDSITFHSENFGLHSSFMERLQSLVLQSQKEPIFETMAESLRVEDRPTNEAMFRSRLNAARKHGSDYSAIVPSASLRALSHTVGACDRFQICVDDTRPIPITSWMSVPSTATKTCSFESQNPQKPSQTCFVPVTTQLELYNTIAVLEPPLIVRTPTNFVYGPASLGETNKIAALPRIVPRSMLVLFQMSQTEKGSAEDSSYDLGYIDSYQNDLLIPRQAHDKLPMRTNAKGATLVVGLTKVRARNASQNRTTCAKLFNHASSRSYEMSSMEVALIVEHTSKTRNMAASFIVISGRFSAYSGEINANDFTAFEHNMHNRSSPAKPTTITIYNMASDVKFRSDVLNWLNSTSQMRNIYTKAVADEREGSLMRRTSIQGRLVLVIQTPVPGLSTSYGLRVHSGTTSDDGAKGVEVDVKTELLVVEAMDIDQRFFRVSSGVRCPSLVKIRCSTLVFSAFASTALLISPSGSGIKIKSSMASTVHVTASGTSQSYPPVVLTGLLNSLDDAEPVASQHRSKLPAGAITTLIACLYNRSLWRSFSFETHILPSVCSSNKMLPQIRSRFSLTRTVSSQVTFFHPIEGTPAANHRPVDNTTSLWTTFEDFLVVCRRDVIILSCLYNTTTANMGNNRGPGIQLRSDRISMRACPDGVFGLDGTAGKEWSLGICKLGLHQLGISLIKADSFGKRKLIQFWLRGLALSMDFRYLAIPYGTCVDIYDLKSNVNKPLARYSGPKERKISVIAWSSELPRLVMSFEGGSAYIVTMNERSSTIAGFHHSGQHERAKVPAAFLDKDLIAIAMENIVEIRNCVIDDDHRPHWELLQTLPQPIQEGKSLAVGDIHSIHVVGHQVLLAYDNGTTIIWSRRQQSQSHELTFQYEDTILLPGIMSRNDVCPKKRTILVTAPGTYQVFSIGSKTAQNIFIPRDPLERTPQAVSSAKFLSDDLIIGAGVGQLVLWDADLGNRLQNLIFRNQDPAVTAFHICSAYNAEEDIGWIVTAQGSEVTFWKTIDCLGGETSADRAGNSCLQDGVAGSGDSKENRESQLSAYAICLTVTVLMPVSVAHIFSGRSTFISVKRKISIWIPALSETFVDCV
ncbi:hypothetical protein F5879DRAFT_926799 [Lentinula edodes]|nr:hypothetical protein F5879DRAFT_926799 [Lentinula edodes]